MAKQEFLLDHSTLFKNKTLKNEKKPFPMVYYFEAKNVFVNIILSIPTSF